MSRPGKFLATVPLLLLLLIAFSGHARAATCSVDSITATFQIVHNFTITDEIDYHVSADWTTPTLVEDDELDLVATYYDANGVEIAHSQYEAQIAINSESCPPVSRASIVYFNGRIAAGSHAPANAKTCVYHYHVTVSVTDGTTTYASDSKDSGSYTITF